MSETPPIGHNSGEPDALPILRQEPDLATHLAKVAEPMLARTKELLENAPAKAKVFDDAADADATEFLLAIRAEIDAAKKAKTEERLPYQTLVELVDAYFLTNIYEPLKAQYDRINEASGNYKVGVMRAAQIQRDLDLAAAAKIKKAADDKAAADRAEALRLEQAAARARKPENVAALTAAAEEAHVVANVSQAGAVAVAVDHAEAVSEAATSAADTTRIHGKRVGVSSLRTTVKPLDLIDRKALAAMYAVDEKKNAKAVTPGIVLLAPYFTDAAILAAARAYEKANKATVGEHLDAGTQPIAGITFVEDFTNVPRK